MKIYFPIYHSRTLLTVGGDARWMIAFMIICLLSILCGLCFVWGGLLAFAVFGIVGILLASAAYALINRSKIDNTTAAPIKKSVPRITSGWDYRPRNAIRRSTAIDDVAAESAEVLGSSAGNENDYVWFNALECSADTLIDPSSADPRAQEECALAAHPDIVYTVDTVEDGVVSMYDQSPIDE